MPPLTHSPLFFVQEQSVAIFRFTFLIPNFFVFAMFPASFELISKPRFLTKCFAKTLMKNNSKLFLLNKILCQEISMIQLYDIAAQLFYLHSSLCGVVVLAYPQFFKGSTWASPLTFISGSTWFMSCVLGCQFLGSI